MYFLKCLLLIIDGYDFRKKLVILEKKLLVLKVLDWDDVYFVRSLMFDLMFMYRVSDEFLLIIEKVDRKRL